MEKLNFDVAIIGAGVAGMTAGIYLKSWYKLYHNRKRNVWWTN